MQWCKVDQLLHNQCSGSSGENNNSTTSATAPGTASSGDTGVGAKAGRSTNARTESDQCVGTTPIITNEIAFSAACETVWFGALVA